MKMEELRQLSVDELQLKYEDILEEMENLRFQHSTHQLDNPLRIRLLRKDIARIKTIFHEQELGNKK
ncbi:50S ribosomal protein L29 [candidate division KSB1 bacterium]|nr:50S ribosomal protein L29 [candidate division KSB1 bacterium]